MTINVNATFRKDKIKSNNTAPIHIRFTLNRKIRYVSTGVIIHINKWDFENQRIKDNSPEMQELQYSIDSKLNEYRRKIKRLEALEVNVTLDNLLETNGRKINCTVGEYLKQTIERLETLGKYGSASKHRSLLSRLSEFRSLNTRFDEIDLAFLHDFELFLRKEGNVNNSIATKFAIFKAAYNKALAEGLFLQKINPFAKYKVGSLWTRTRKRAITKEDIQKLVALEIAPNYRTDYAEFARDIFLFSYYTAGINFTDMATLRYCDIVDGRIYYSRHKTQKLLSFQLVPNAMRIIEKYSRANHAQEDYIFPILDRTEHKTAQQIFNRTHKVLRKVNRELKTLGEQIGLEWHICWRCSVSPVRICGFAW
ncbi:phage integrase SAM-like domain-containing protein [Alistipes sp.]|uniref:phage integrase SAM-like domain-containing protein n=1 Tax=Alistipes sp. TaxID=1872444 RepID=UPI003AF8EE6D